MLDLFIEVVALVAHGGTRWKRESGAWLRSAPTTLAGCKFAHSGQRVPKKLAVD
jgi:hypothetical protein